MFITKISCKWKGRETIFMPPLKKGAYCFATVGRSVGWSVGMSVCRSVDQVLSDQYLLTPSLHQYQTWCRGCPPWVDDPYWFSGHMIKGQGQTTLLSPLCCSLKWISFNPLLTCFGQVFLLQRRYTWILQYGGIYVSETFLVLISLNHDFYTSTYRYH